MCVELRNPGEMTIFSCEAPSSPVIAASNCFSLTFVSCVSAAIRAALIIQNWYRGYRARLKTRQRYALTIFQSIEYADEQGQLQVCFVSLSLILVNCFSLLLVIERMTGWDHFKLRNLSERL